LYASSTGTNYDDPVNAPARAQLIERVKRALHKGKTTLAYGHWFQTFLTRSELVKEVEYINILRECKSRTKSNFLFDLEVKSLGFNLFEDIKTPVNPVLQRQREARSCYTKGKTHY